MDGMAEPLQAWTKTPGFNPHLQHNLIKNLTYMYIEVVLSHEEDNWKHALMSKA